MEYKEWFHDLKTSELHLNDLEPKLKKPNLDYDMWLSKDIFKVDKIYLKKYFVKIIYLKL